MWILTISEFNKAKSLQLFCLSQKIGVTNIRTFLPHAMIRFYGNAECKNYFCKQLQKYSQKYLFKNLNTSVKFIQYCKICFMQSKKCRKATENTLERKIV